MKTIENNRQRIARDVDRFLAAGGSVQKIPAGVSGEPDFAKRVSREENKRRLAKQRISERAG